MALSVFVDRSEPPDDKELKAALGKTFALWTDLQKVISAQYAPLTIEWGCASKSAGWGLRLKKEKRAVLYMTPCKGYFLASFALGEKAVKLAHESGLPVAVLKVIDEAPKYAEGRGVRFEVRTKRDVRNIEKVAAIKMST
jgi:hypothetical protein